MSGLTRSLILRGPSAIASYTSAQLAAMAAAGTLTPLATYVPSDASPPYQLWARDASTLIAPDGFVANSAASMAALSLAVVGARCTRTDDISGGPDGTEYMLMRLPSTRPHHWKPVYNGAAHMLFGARPDARDVPYGTVIAGTDILNARFVAQTKNGVTDWYPEGGEQLIARWEGETALYVASQAGAAIVPNAVLIPAGVQGLFGAIYAKFFGSQLYNTTASGTPRIAIWGQFRAIDMTATYTAPSFNASATLTNTLSSGVNITNKKATIQGGFVRALGQPYLYAYGPDPSQPNIDPGGSQIQYGYRALDQDFALDIYSGASATNCTGKLIAVEITVRG